MEDNAIIKLYFDRNETAISETDRKYGAYCRTLSNRILLDLQDADECVNDTWLRAWYSMPPHRPNVLRQFLAKITRNVSLDRYRSANAEKRGGGEVELALEELAECIGGGDPAEQAELDALRDTMLLFLDSLPVKEQKLFLLRYFYLEKIAQIAEKYNMKDANVRLILSRTRKKLKEFLHEEGWL